MATRVTKKSGPVTVLKRARELIADGWIKGDFNAEKNGKQHFCAIGAVQHAAGQTDKWGMEDEVTALLEQSLRGESANGDVISFNDADHRRKKDVLKLFDRAIALAKSGSLRAR